MPELTLAQAQAAKEAIITRAVDGEKIEPAEYEAAEQAIARARLAEDLESARAKGAKQRAEQRAVADLAVKVKELEAAYDAAVDKRIEAAARVDELLCLAQDALQDFHSAGITVFATAKAMNEHNTAVEHYLSVHNETLAAIHISQRPRCRRVDAWQAAKPEAKLAVTEGMGWDRRERQIHSLEARTRTEHRRPHVKENAA
jgi:hypothetical protein